jgi:hypothetical protein
MIVGFSERLHEPRVLLRDYTALEASIQRRRTVEGARIDRELLRKERITASDPRSIISDSQSIATASRRLVAVEQPISVREPPLCSLPHLKGIPGAAFLLLAAVLPKSA